MSCHITSHHVTSRPTQPQNGTKTDEIQNPLSNFYSKMVESTVKIFYILRGLIKKCVRLLVSISLVGSQKVITTIQGLMLSYEALEPSLSPFVALEVKFCEPTKDL
jgi:hypothetical protein